MGIARRRAFGPVLLLASTSTWFASEGTTYADCTSPANVIEAENCKTGNPASEWDVSGAGDTNLQGFATDISVNRGETISFKVDTTATAYRVDIYRLGYYAGLGARRVATIPNANTTKTNQPACLTDAATGLVDCGNWSVSATWSVPSDAASGIYVAKLVGEAGVTGSSHVVFVVRADGVSSDLLFQTSDTTWQAYNRYGGVSLYGGSGPGGGLSGAGRAYKVSYNRPFTTRGTTPEDWVFNAEYPMVRWLERNGYDVSYSTDVDTDRRGAEIARHKVFLSVGHDEYWSKQQWLNVEKARDQQFPGQVAPVHLAFFSGNETFWKTRWEPSIDGSATSNRTLVCYKETHEGAKIDPSPEWTGTWRDPRFSPPSDGGRPENAISGTIFTVNGVRNDALEVPAAEGQMRFWRNTPNVSALSGSQVWTGPAGTVGYEWDEDLDNGARPDGLVRLSMATVNVPGRILDFGSTYGPGTATHRAVFHRRANGALVFGAGTVQWSWGLDGDHDRGSEPPSVDMQQATVNLLADMGVQPATLQAGLLPASASADVVAPVSDITSPADNATVPVSVPVTIQGTATDGPPGLVGGVEVSVDGGLTWHPAEGRGTWSYVWTPAVAGSYNVLSRAVDDSGNIESPGVGSTINVGSAPPPSGSVSIWGGGGSPATVNEYDGQELELGVKFRSSVAGYVTAIRFYKGNLDSGTHVGSLWSSTGALLASAPFGGETASGWQEVALPSPVAIAPNTTYVASYHSTPGYYVSSTGYFTSAVVNGPLTALADGTDGPNGIYKYGAPGFPAQSYRQSNYWVDVVFTASAPGPDTTPPTVTATSPASGATGVAVSAPVTAVFGEALAAGTVSGTTAQLRDASSQLVLASVSWNAATNSIVLQPTSALAYSTMYSATIKGGAGGVTDVAGNPLSADFTWTFTTQGSGDTVPPPGWYAGDMHVHRSCGGPPESLSNLFDKMAENNLATISLLADMGNGEVQDPVQDLPRVTGLDDPISTPGRIVHWDAEWHWDATYTQYPHQALGGHIVALGLDEAQPVWEEYTYPVFEWIRQRGGIAGFAHMQYVGDGIPQSLDCCKPLEYPIEVALGSAQFISEDVLGSDSAIRAYYRLLNTGFRPGLAAGTDYPCGVSTIGSLLTYVQVAGGQMTYRNWIEGIAAGRTVVSRNGQDEFLGLTVNGAATPGDEIRLTGGGGPVSVNIQWTANRSLSGTIELVHNGAVVAAQATSVAAGIPATLSTTANFAKSGWLAARRMDGNGHRVHTAAVFVIVNDAPVRASADDANFFVQWIDNLLDKTAVGGDWSSFFTTSREAARARYQAAKSLFQQIAAEAGAGPPTVTSVAPAGGASNVPVGTTVTATFSKPLAPATVNGSTVELRDSDGLLVSATVTWNPVTTSIVLEPTSALAYSTTYTATVRGGAGGVTDAAGNPLAADFSWTFTTGASAPSGSVSIWAGTGSPATVNEYDGQELELGVKFRSSLAGYVSAIRFYKGNLDTGTHVASLWTSTGTLLASAPFASETASGWQEVTLPSPVAIAANTTYVASYHSRPGYYVASTGYFAQAVVNGPLTALADGTDGPNGVYKYGAAGFPTQTYQRTNYWVDVVFSTQPPGPDTTPPSLLATTPASGASGVLVSTSVTARFSEPLAANTVNGTTMVLRDGAAQLVPATVTWDSTTNSAVLRPTLSLGYSTAYTATVKGGSGGMADVAGNPLAADVVWTFTTQAPPPPPPEEGPGGPILVIGHSANPFARYYAEVLRTEGLNAFKVIDISAVDSTVLGQYDVAILGEMPLSATQVTMLSNWVNAGGNLIAMRPDPQLATLLGIVPSGTSLTEGYLAVDTSRAPGRGIVGQTIQFHGTANRYSLAAATPGAVAVATLYSNATTPTPDPAVTLRSVGGAGGEAAAFAFDLARSIVYTRQGNPAWAGDERDGVTPRRSDDLFFGAKSGDVKPDWVDLNKVAIPQADELQRLLANLILGMSADRKLLPRFWYFPRGEKAVVVMAVDNHGADTVEQRFAAEEAASPAGCSVADWECIRSTAYVYLSGLPDDATAKQWEDKGFEVALHVNTNCSDWTPTTLPGFFTSQKADFVSKFPSVAPLATNRTHCIVWSDWATQPKVELAQGIRFETNYYYWPPGWVDDTPGLFTGSGMPMRFADLDGSMIDVYQASTQMTDESGQTYPYTINTLLDRALGAEGYYGAFTANIHADGSTDGQAAAIVSSAKARSVPVVSAKQMLAWLDGRNGSSFEAISWSGGVLTFGVAVGAGANGLQAMVPSAAGGSPLTALTRSSVTVPFTKQTIKGIEYAVFPADPGTYQAAYTIDTTPPLISSVSVAVGTGGRATVQWSTDEPATSLVGYGTAPGSLTQTASAPLLLTTHSVLLTGLAADTTYYYEVTSVDAAGNSATSSVDSFVTTPVDSDPPTVTLLAPNGGERLFTGSPYVVQWTAVDDVGVTSIDVTFSSDGGAGFTAVAGCTGLAGTAQSCTWTAPGPATTQGRIRVTARDAAGQSGSATSSADFTVVSGTPSLTLTAPTTAVTWRIGDTNAVSFNHNLGVGATVVIDLSRDGGVTWTTINPAFVTTSTTTGTFSWVVTGPATTSALVRLTWSGNPAVSSTSGTDFTIANWITVTAPNTAVTWPTGSTQSIAWSHSLGTSQPVNVDLSRDGGSTWSSIATNAANATSTTGTYSWVVTGPATGTARIRVSASTSPAVSDTSDANFTISGTIAVTSPASGVRWGVGSHRTIAWNHTLGGGQTFNILLSTDGGSTFPMTLASGVAGDATSGSYDWVVSGATSTQARVRVVWTPNTAVRGTTGNFTIQAASVTVTAPNTAVNWTIGTTRSITWSHNLGTGEAVNIDKSTDGGATWTSIATSVPNSADTTGTYGWTVSGPASTTARIRVSWASSTSVTDLSNVDFTVANPFVTVTSPNTNVAWSIGSSRNLRFNHNLGAGQVVTIEISRDGGATFSPITTFTTTSASSGSYPWVVTGPATTQGRVRVTWVGNPAVTDISNVNFRIQ
jgi:hypothetical protein